MRPRARVLGSAAGGGVPQWNCRCRICCLARNDDPRVKRRTQASLAVTGDGETWTLLGASPDLRTQLEACAALHPNAGLRHSPLNAVVLSSAEIDHVAGLLILREGHAFQLFATEPVLAMLASNPMLDALHPQIVHRRSVVPGVRFAASRGVELSLVAVPGKAPLYAEEFVSGSEKAEFTTAVLVTVGSVCVVWMPACASVTDDVLSHLRPADIILFDGTVFTDNELIDAGVGNKTGARMGHVAISGLEGSLARLAGLDARRRIYVHLNNTNPVLIEGSQERAEVERAGWEVAYDGMEIAL
jgi:pyrroloquinoline quinone biosynthesis protein B